MDPLFNTPFQLKLFSLSSEKFFLAAIRKGSNWNRGRLRGENVLSNFSICKGSFFMTATIYCICDEVSSCGMVLITLYLGENFDHKFSCSSVKGESCDCLPGV